MKKIKKLLAGFAALIVLTGCSYLDAERVDCYECGDSVTRWIDLASGEYVCATCFEKREYQVCLDCGLGYRPDDGGVDGYCERCAENDTQYCIQCEERKSIEDLVELDDSSYICVKCLYSQTNSYDNYNDGYNDGYDDGQKAGYNSGYSKGFSEGKASVKTTASTASTASSPSSSSSGTSTPATSEPQSVTVYITNTGSKYHRSGCQYLRKSCIPISLDNAKSRGYTACSKCW